MDNTKKSLADCISILEKDLLHVSKIVHGFAFMLKDVVHHDDSIISSVKCRSVYPLLHMSAISSITLCELVGNENILPRDCYGISRSILEAIVNALYILSKSDEDAQNALDHVEHRFLRSLDVEKDISGVFVRTRQGLGRSSIQNKRLAELDKKFLTANGRQKNWSEDSIYKKIELLGSIYGENRILGIISSSLFIYDLASEYLHSTIYSAYHFYGFELISSQKPNIEDLKEKFSEHKTSCLIMTILLYIDFLKCFGYIIDNTNQLKSINKEISRLTNNLRIISEYYEA